MGSFHAFRIERDPEGAVQAAVTRMRLEDLSEGEVLIRADWSSVNYKDALAATGDGHGVMRRFPLNGGIDVAGEVSESSDPRFAPGDEVLVTGHRLSETHDGGYAEYVRVPGDWVIRLPEGLSLREAMGLGTAGFTAALALHRMEENGQAPALGPIVVTGATGGVGSLAVSIFAHRGYTVHAVTTKLDQRAYLESLGAEEILPAAEARPTGKPLQSARFAGAVDCVGGAPLAWLLSVVSPLGNIAAIGNAAGAELRTTVLPFILRGVNLLGINSTFVARELQEEIWTRLATELGSSELKRIVRNEVSLEGLPTVFELLLSGRAVGRTVVRID